MAIAALTEDIDADGVPDAVDNCTLVPNGPNDTATAGPSQNTTARQCPSHRSGFWVP